ncbi:MAG: TrbI/VirB10 family protein [Parvularculaceae bacterium]
MTARSPFPTGSSAHCLGPGFVSEWRLLQIDAMPGTDAAGYAGLSDKVDNHWGRVFVAAGLASLLGIGTELAVVMTMISA